MTRFSNPIVLLALALFLFVAGTIPAQAKQDHPEAWYQSRWCAKNGGKAEVTLPDQTRCDCITAEHAIEFDFGRKWAEAIGQALYYGIQTGQKPGIVLILEDANDRKYYIRLNTVIQKYGLDIDVWSVGAGAY